MKLSQLEALVRDMRLLSKEGTDPEVRFHKRRQEGEVCGPRDSTAFVQYEIQESADPAWSYKVVAASSGIIAKVGDFDLPLVVAPFYKE